LQLDFPNLPYLIDGDFRLTGSRAIYYYIIEKAKRGEELLGKHFRERARILNVTEVVLDVLDRIEHLIYN
jgi:glutathione S-transferase